MRIRESYIALNADGHIVHAANVAFSSAGALTCHHCGCPLQFHPTGGGIPAWFEHDARALTNTQLIKCAYFDSLSQADLRHLALQRQLQQMQPVKVVHQWHCIQCGHRYSGPKSCPQCGQGIYSVEASPHMA
ncbi:putative zinc ribbon protein [Citrobacter werkmanii]|uniref:putative zinc ribbon protein n=1 Tax=Citrobacter werkmanii TaxID=67827 RepID=UPI002654FD61|nr:putative zinc ribbon protein [Citrobacter werkmanii]MDN8559126.1 putative zinc ribbon protein [Citrobacter werkmanii]